MRSPLESTASENQQCLNAFSEPPKRIPMTEWLGQGTGTRAKGRNVYYHGYCCHDNAGTPGGTCPTLAQG